MAAILNEQKEYKVNKKSVLRLMRLIGIQDFYPKIKPQLLTKRNINILIS
ncbi:MAG: hypothetical protein ACI9TO_001225 [Rickettsiales bacterium]